MIPPVISSSARSGSAPRAIGRRDQVLVDGVEIDESARGAGFSPKGIRTKQRGFFGMGHPAKAVAFYSCTGARATFKNARPRLSARSIVRAYLDEFNFCMDDPQSRRAIIPGRVFQPKEARRGRQREQYRRGRECAPAHGGAYVLFPSAPADYLTAVSAGSVKRVFQLGHRPRPGPAGLVRQEGRSPCRAREVAETIRDRLLCGRYGDAGRHGDAD